MSFSPHSLHWFKIKNSPHNKGCFWFKRTQLLFQWFSHSFKVWWWRQRLTGSSDDSVKVQLADLIWGQSWSNDHHQTTSWSYSMVELGPFACFHLWSTKRRTQQSSVQKKSQSCWNHQRALWNSALQRTSPSQQHHRNFSSESKILRYQFF